MILYGMRVGCRNMAGPLCTACLVPLCVTMERVPREGSLVFSSERELKQYQGSWGCVDAALATTDWSASTHPVVSPLSFLAENLGFIVLGLAPILGSGRADCFCSQIPATLQGFCSSSMWIPSVVLIYPLSVFFSASPGWKYFSPRVQGYQSLGTGHFYSVLVFNFLR